MRRTTVEELLSGPALDYYRVQVVRSRQRDAFLKGAEELLRRYSWDVFATLSFRFPVNRDHARAKVHAWFKNFGDQAYAYAAYERGRDFGREHVHVLIGGLTSFGKSLGGDSWTHGNCEWSEYRHGGGAAAYLFKDAWVEPESGEFIGAKPIRRRRSRS